LASKKQRGQSFGSREATGLDGMWGTPALVKIDENRTDLVMLVAKEVWGLDPENGKLRWHTDATGSAQAYTSIISHETRVFAFSGGGSVALNLGEAEETGDTTTAWSGRVNATYSSPVRHHSKLYVVSRGILSVVDANSGVRLKQIRLKGSRITGNARFGSLDYASPVVVGDRLFYQNASGQMFVISIRVDLPTMAVNEVTTDKELFWGSPAVSDGRMVYRSSKYLYCVADKRDTVPPREAKAAGSVESDSKRPSGAAPTASRNRRSGGKTAERRAKYRKLGNDERPDRPQRPVSAKR
jgi:outer membrane protein assembly factor BamB